MNTLYYSLLIHRACLILVCFLLSFFCRAQKFQNIQLELRGHYVDISYDLVGIEGRTYTILVYSSHNNSNTPLEFVSGDVGEGIVPGTGKKIVWNANLEIGNKNIEVNIGLDGETEPPFVSITNPSGGKFKKGKQNEITWKSDSDNRIRIEVLKTGKPIKRLGDLPNNGVHSWDIAKDFENGKDYQLRFSNLSNDKEFVISDYFTIGPAFGMGAKIGAGVVIAGTIVYLATREKPEEPIPLPAKPDE